MADIEIHDDSDYVIFDVTLLESEIIDETPPQWLVFGGWVGHLVLTLFVLLICIVSYL